MLLVLDALADHGASGGVDGAASSLDLAVRAASAIAEHHVRSGDRVALRVVGRGRELVGYGAGARHLRRIQHTLAGIRPGEVGESDAGVLQLGVTGGTVVILLSPMLAESIGAVAATLTRRGVPLLVVDTLPADVRPGVAEGTDPELASLAWRMRRLERTVVLQRLGALGCPVVPLARAGHHRRRAAPAGPARRPAPGGVAMTGLLAALAGLSRSQLVLRVLIVARPGGRGARRRPGRALAAVVGGGAGAGRARVGGRGLPGVAVRCRRDAGRAGLVGRRRSTTACTRPSWSPPRRWSLAHVAAVLASYGPGEMPVERRPGAVVGAPRRAGAARRARGLGPGAGSCTTSPSSRASGCVGVAAGLVATVAAAVALPAREPGEQP